MEQKTYNRTSKVKIDSLKRPMELMNPEKNILGTN